MVFSGYGGYGGYYAPPTTVIVHDYYNCGYGYGGYGYGGYGGYGYNDALLGAGAGFLGGALLGAIIF